MNKQSLSISLCILSLAAFIIVAPAHSNNLIVYPAPPNAPLNTDFDVRVRQSGNKWMDTPAYLVKVDEVRGTAHHVENASMSYFDFSGEVEVSVTSNRGPIETARIRPLSLQLTPEIKGNTLTFKLNKACNISVEVNGDIFHNLHLFANPVDTYKPDPKDKNLIFFGPGIHYLEKDKLYVPSGKTVYIAGGAILMGQVLIENVHDVKLIGRGMIDHTVKMGIHIANSKNIYVEGLFCTQLAIGGSDNVTVSNCKSISYYGWGDGMNVFASNNVFYDGVFCRNSDDCTTVYATRKGFSGGCKNIVMQNATLWADVAHPIQIGTHGSTPNHDVIEDITYRNIDILDHNEMQIDYQGCMSINAGDDNLIRNITFEDIRVEDFRRGQLVNIRVFFNSKYCTSPGRSVENIVFRNITYNGQNAEISIIAGYNEERKAKNVIFENLIINGRVISDDMPGKPTWYKTSDMARFFVGEHVEGVEFNTGSYSIRSK